MNKQKRTVLLLSKKNSRRRWNTHKTLKFVSCDNSIICLAFFIHSFEIFKTLIQSFYIAFSENNIRTRNKISAGVQIIRRRNNYTRGWWAPKNFRNLYKSHSAENCAENEHSISLYIETN